MSPNPPHPTATFPPISGVFLGLIFVVVCTLGCDTQKLSVCTEIVATPFISPIVFDGSQLEIGLFGWGAYGVFSTEDTDMLKMTASVGNDTVVQIDPREDSDAFLQLRVVGRGETVLSLSVTNECGDQVLVEVPVIAELPLGRQKSMCEGGPSGVWVDYWPIEVGNNWLFRYEGRVAESDGGLRKRGTARLTIVDSQCSDNLAQHTAVINYDYVIFLNSDFANTNERVVYEDSLHIEENPVGQLSISGFTEVDQIRVRQMILSRYHLATAEDPISQEQIFTALERTESIFVLNRYIGPARISAGSQAGSSLHDIRMNLLDHFVASEL